LCAREIRGAEREREFAGRKRGEREGGKKREGGKESPLGERGREGG